MVGWDVTDFKLPDMRVEIAHELKVRDGDIRSAFAGRMMRAAVDDMYHRDSLTDTCAIRYDIRRYTREGVKETLCHTTGQLTKPVHTILTPGGAVTCTSFCIEYFDKETGQLLLHFHGAFDDDAVKGECEVFFPDGDGEEWDSNVASVEGWRLMQGINKLWTYWNRGAQTLRPGAAPAPARKRRW